MQLCVGKDVTNKSEIQQPFFMGTLGQGGAYSSASGSDRLISDITAGYMMGLETVHQEHILGSVTDRCL